MRSDEKCCCFCRHNIRTEENGYVKCHCDIDGHEIGYVACFEDWCRRWARSKKKDKIELEEEENKLLWEDDDSEGGLISEE